MSPNNISSVSVGRSHTETDAANLLLTREDALSALVDDEQPLLDVLSSFWGHKNVLLRRNALEVHVRRLYRMYAISKLRIADGSKVLPQVDEVQENGPVSMPLPLQVHNGVDDASGMDFLVARWVFTPKDGAVDLESRDGKAASEPGNASTRIIGSIGALTAASKFVAGAMAHVGSALSRARHSTTLSIAESSNDLAALAVQARLIDSSRPSGGQPSLLRRAPTLVTAQASEWARHGALAVFADVNSVRTSFPLLLSSLACGPDTSFTKLSPLRDDRTCDSGDSGSRCRVC